MNHYIVAPIDLRRAAYVIMLVADVLAPNNRHAISNRYSE